MMDLGEEAEAELQELVDRLDRLVPSEDAHLTLPADAEGRTTAGNRVGYLRLGIELLRAALAPLPASDEAPARVVPQVEGLLTEGSRSPFELCELDESIGSRPPAQSRLGGFGQMSVGVGVVLALVLAFIGAVVLWRWLFG
jgi:hypothetical protein